MTTTSAPPPAPPLSRPRQSFAGGLVHRQIDAFPNTGNRLLYLALTVIATATLYYELYVTAAVNSLQLVDLHMSFLFYATLIAVSYLAGAFGSVAAGIVDRLGRVNFLVGGLIVTGVLTAWVIPECTTKVPFAIFTCIVGFVEGICLVSTPALIRDYSPQVGRATAMGFWTMGPVLGSLVVSLVGSATIENGTPNKANATLLDGATRWQHEYHICGIVGIVVAVLCLLLLKELSPRLRDQVLVSMHDRMLVEARAAGLDLEEATKHPWRQMIKPDILISAAAISIFLLIYYTLVGTSVIYYETAFKREKPFTLSQANDLGNWQWVFLLAFLIIIGALSDKLRVRKPMMVVGGVGAAIMLVVFLQQAGTDASFSKMALIVALLSTFIGIAYTPWMASFTETIEARNPALTANGLAVWGWIVRVVIFASFLIIPQIVSTTSELADHGSAVTNAAAKYSTPLPASGLPTGVLGFAQAPANAPLVAFATKNAALLGNYTTYAPEITTFQALPADRQAALATGATPTASDVQILSAAATKVSGALAAQAPQAKAAAAEARVIGIPMQAPPVPSATDILTSLNSNKAAILTTGAGLTMLLADPSSAAMVAKVQTDAAQLGVLTVAGKQADFAYLQAHATQVIKASSQTAGQWKDWYWVCFGGVIFFLLSIPLMKGHWSPRKAKAEFERHEQIVDAELAKLHT